MASYREPDPTPESIGLRIAGFRLARGWTIEKLAQKARDFDKTQLARIEAGKAEPRVATLVRLARALEVHVVELLATTRELEALRLAASRPEPLEGEALAAERAAAAKRARKGKRPTRASGRARR